MKYRLRRLEQLSSRLQTLNNYWMRLSIMIARIHDQGRSLCYLPKPKAEADNANRGLAKTESNNCFISFIM